MTTLQNPLPVSMMQQSWHGFAGGDGQAVLTSFTLQRLPASWPCLVALRVLSCNGALGLCAPRMAHLGFATLTWRARALQPLTWRARQGFNAALGLLYVSCKSSGLLCFAFTSCGPVARTLHTLAHADVCSACKHARGGYAARLLPFGMLPTLHY